jgi:hypothetical protein
MLVYNILYYDKWEIFACYWRIETFVSERNTEERNGKNSSKLLSVFEILDYRGGGLKVIGLP